MLDVPFMKLVNNQLFNLCSCRNLVAAEVNGLMVLTSYKDHLVLSGDEVIGNHNLTKKRKLNNIY